MAGELLLLLGRSQFLLPRTAQCRISSEKKCVCIYSVTDRATVCQFLMHFECGAARNCDPLQWEGDPNPNYLPVILAQTEDDLHRQDMIYAADMQTHFPRINLSMGGWHHKFHVSDPLPTVQCKSI